MLFSPIFIELNSKDAVDLKVLLRLPMTRMRDLRRFLSSYNVKLLPSDKQLYEEMSCKCVKYNTLVIHMNKTA